MTYATRGPGALGGKGQSGGNQCKDGGENELLHLCPPYVGLRARPGIPAPVAEQFTRKPAEASWGSICRPISRRIPHAGACLGEPAWLAIRLRK